MSGPLSNQLAQNLAAKLASDQLVLFVGAGISYQATNKANPSRKMPLWNELATRVARSLDTKLEDYGGNVLDLFDGICHSQGRQALEDAVRSAIADREFEPSRVHHLISTLPWHIVYTTNYDSLLLRAMSEKKAIVAEKDYELLRRPRDSRPRLIHLHGDLDDMHTLTADDYSLWDEKHPIAKTNLMEIGLNKTFLFIGYSNSDPHLRFGLFPWIRKMGRDREGRNFAWMWNATEQQVKLLDRVSKIEVTSLCKDEDWERALEQVYKFYALLPKINETKKLSIRSHDLSNTSKVQDKLHLNGYKLFYHRTQKRLSINELSKRSGVQYRRIKRIERVSKTSVSDSSCFALSNRDEIDALELALGCRGQLQYGSDDDFLATYIMYYKANAGLVKKHENVDQPLLFPTTKGVVFDFGGTLTLPNPPHNTWERIWLSVGYGIHEAADLHRSFNAGKISHQLWCDLTRDKLRERNFSRAHLDKIAEEIRPVAGLSDVFKNLSQRGIPIYIVSGSIKHIILSTLGQAYSLVEEIKCNDFLFDENSIIREIRGHDFDFEGKAKFISRVVEARRCRPIEILFIGNSLNDHWAIKSGARTLCVNPSHTDFTNKLVWSDYIKEMSDLSQVLKYI